MRDAIKSLLNLSSNRVLEKEGCGEKKGIDNNILLIENHTLPERFALIEQHKMHLNFFKEHGMCDEDKKENLISKIEDILIIINN